MKNILFFLFEKNIILFYQTIKFDDWMKLDEIVDFLNIP